MWPNGRCPARADFVRFFFRASSITARAPDNREFSWSLVLAAPVGYGKIRT